MTVIVKSRASLTIPLRVQRQAGIKVGDRLQFKVSGGIINVIPEPPAPVPPVNDEYTPAQRRAIDARLKAARKSPPHGPFDTADQAIDFLRKEIRARKAARRK